MSTKAHQSVRLFRNPILEALTHVHPSLPFIIWIPAVAYLLMQARSSLHLDFLMIGLFFGLGLIFWSFTEYAMHRYVFHYKADTKMGKYLVFLFHGIHHDDPQDPTRLVMPPVVSITLGIAFFYLFKVVLSDNGTPFFCGFIVGYMIYDYLHFAIHHFRPRTAWGKSLKEHHMKHHFIAHGAKWGVSSGLWDRVFRSMS